MLKNFHYDLRKSHISNKSFVFNIVKKWTICYTETFEKKNDLRSFFLQVNKYVGTSRVKISVLDVTFFYTNVTENKRMFNTSFPHTFRKITFKNQFCLRTKNLRPFFPARQKKWWVYLFVSNSPWKLIVYFKNRKK